jgi:hypothetical protein
MLRVEGVGYNFKGHHQEIHKGHWKGPQKKSFDAMRVMDARNISI